MHRDRELTTDELSVVYGGASSAVNPLPHPQPSPWDRLVHWFLSNFR